MGPYLGVSDKHQNPIGQEPDTSLSHLEMATSRVRALGAGLAKPEPDLVQILFLKIRTRPAPP